jgi:hypothetical protein
VPLPSGDHIWGTAWASGEISEKKADREGNEAAVQQGSGFFLWQRSSSPMQIATLRPIYSVYYEIQGATKMAAAEQTQRQPQMGLTFEKVWAMFQETDRKFQETDRQLNKLSKQMGDLHNRFGEIAEHLVAPGIARRFNEVGYQFDEIATKGQTIRGKDGKIRAEIDLLMENEHCIIAVEVKTKPKTQDIEHHIKRLEILREIRSGKGDSRRILGAIAGAIFDANVKEAVIEAGFYALEQSGDTIRLDIPGDFVPREW